MAVIACSSACGGDRLFTFVCIYVRSSVQECRSRCVSSFESIYRQGYAAICMQLCAYFSLNASVSV